MIYNLLYAYACIRHYIIQVLVAKVPVSHLAVAGQEELVGAACTAHDFATSPALFSRRTLIECF